MTSERKELPLPEDVLSKVVGFLNPKERAQLRATSRAGRLATQIENLEKNDLERIFLERNPKLSRRLVANKIECYTRGLEAARSTAKKEGLCADPQKLGDQAFLAETFMKFCTRPTFLQFLELGCELYPDFLKKERFKVEYLSLLKQGSAIDIKQLMRSNSGARVLERVIAQTQMIVVTGEAILEEYHLTLSTIDHQLATTEREIDETRKQYREAESFLREKSSPEAGKALKQIILGPLNDKIMLIELELSQIRARRHHQKTTIERLKSEVILFRKTIDPIDLFDTAVKLAIGRNTAQPLIGIRSLLIEQEHLPELHKRFVRPDHLLRDLFFGIPQELLIFIASEEPEQISALLRNGFSRYGDEDHINATIMQRADRLIELHQSKGFSDNTHMHALFSACLNQRDLYQSFNLLISAEPLFIKAKYSFTAEEIYDMTRMFCKSNLEKLQTRYGFKYPADTLKQYFLATDKEIIATHNTWLYLTEQKEVDLNRVIDHVLMNKLTDIRGASWRSKDLMLMLLNKGATVSDEATLQRMVNQAWIDPYLQSLLCYFILREAIQADRLISEDERNARCLQLQTKIKALPIPSSMIKAHLVLMEKAEIPFPSDLLDEDRGVGFYIETDQLKRMLASGDFKLTKVSSVERLLSNHSGLTWDDIKPALDKDSIEIHADNINSLIHQKQLDILEKLACEPLMFNFIDGALLETIASPAVPIALFLKVVDLLKDPVESIDMAKIIQTLAPQDTGGVRLYQLWLKLFTLMISSDREEIYRDWNNFISIAIEHKSEPSMITALLRMGAPLPRTKVLLEMLGFPSHQNSISKESVISLLNHACIEDLDTRQRVVHWMIKQRFSAPLILQFARSPDDWLLQSAQSVLLCYEARDFNVDLLLHHLYIECVPTTGDPLILLNLAISHKVCSETLREFFQLHDPKGRNRWGTPIPIKSKTIENAETAYGRDPHELEEIKRVLTELKEEGERERARLQTFFGRAMSSTTESVTDLSEEFSFKR
ncbi:MAG: hypothetical protein NTW94_05535 [Legionellales bacterium]|nr:hypothetical protein [Legionellales bacterium]